MKSTRFLSLCVISACFLAACGQKGTISVTMPDADETGHIARDFTCQGSARPLRIRIANVPKNVTSLALILQDPDAPNGTFVHWVVYNAPASTAWLTADRLADGAVQGLSGINAAAYVPPCPPSGLHHYRAEVLGLDATLSFETPPTAAQVREAAAKHIVAQGEATVVYSPSADDLPPQ